MKVAVDPTTCQIGHDCQEEEEEEEGGGSRKRKRRVIVSNGDVVTGTSATAALPSGG